ncbi:MULTISPECIES: VacJ family lipoprotein [Ramlibacter]|uniref:VacJ family lipoprotein n=1 Tax=Ramlibacter aquaticus TaxID=2780094 RepID=A0ABR9SCD2_9BURK|nr:MULTISPECIES: VacJ family lipoprotein [Ramlibacter]MBE7940005.1 VacJ family lipoprotein [Ramlibacter aquaticus]
MSAHRVTARALLVALLLPLAGCATMGKDPRDPFEPFNRNVSTLNEKVDGVVLKPVATAYREFVPPLVRTGVSNVFSNLGDAWSAVNSLLQFRLQDAVENLARFQLNSTAGVLGLFDVASDANIERHKEDFGQTLGRWGVPPGPYLVLPLLGPSTLRDTVALPVERYGDLTRTVPTQAEANGLFALRIIDTRANLLRLGDVIEGAALDKYSFTRDAYLQKRRAEIFDDKPRDGDGAEPREDDDGGRIPKLDDGPSAPPAPAASQPDGAVSR